MVYGLLPEINRRADARSKDDHVAERNHQERIDARLVEYKDIEAGHNHRDCEAQDNHHGGKGGSKPADRAVHANLVNTHERRLSDEEDNPGGEGGTVHPQEQRPWRGGVEQSDVDGAAKTQHDEYGEYERHAEIEVPAQECLEQVRRACFFLNASGQPGVSNGHRIPPENVAMSVFALCMSRKGPGPKC